MAKLNRTTAGLLAVYIANDGNDPFNAADWEEQGTSVSVDGTSGRLEVGGGGGSGFALHTGTGSGSRSKRMVQAILEAPSIDGSGYFGAAVCMEGTGGDGTDTSIKTLLTTQDVEAWDSVVNEVSNGTFETEEQHASASGKPEDTQMRASVFHDGGTYEGHDFEGNNALGPVTANVLSSGSSGIFTAASVGDTVYVYDWWDCADKDVICVGLPSGYKLKVRTSGSAVLKSATESSGTATLDLIDVSLAAIVDIVVTNGADAVQATFTPSSGDFVAGGDTFQFVQEFSASDGSDAGDSTVAIVQGDVPGFSTLTIRFD